MLRTVTAMQHVLVVVLVVVCVARSAVTGAAPVPLAATTLVYVGWYAAGVALAPRSRSAGAARWWLLGLAACWLAMVAVSAENVWLGFALWLLAGHFLPLVWATLFTLVTLAVVVLRPAWTTGSITVAGVVGPTIGAIFALMLSRGQQVLIREGIERQRLVSSLVAAQAESEALQDELAAAHRAAGVLGERTRLSRDIHDTLAQGFSSIVLLSRTASVVDGEPALRDLLSRIERTAADNLDEARRVVASLAPAELEASGLAAALQRLLDGFTADTGTPAELRVEGEPAGLPTTLEVALLRTAQGALANVRDHAHASRVVVTLADSGDAVRLDVVDDGRGFDAAAWEARPHRLGGLGGYGLRGARARLTELGGGLDVESAPGDGTALSAHVPVPTRGEEPV